MSLGDIIQVAVTYRLLAISLLNHKTNIFKVNNNLSRRRNKYTMEIFYVNYTGANNR